MKRTLLILTTVAMSFGMVQAQTNSITSNNIPNGSGTGYLFDFNGTDTDNCGAGATTNIPNSNIGLQASYSTSSLGNGQLAIGVDGSQQGWHNYPLRMYTDNCSDQNINLSNDQSYSIRLVSTMDVPQFIMMFGDQSGVGITDSLPTIWSLTANTPVTLSASDINFHQWTASTTIDSTQIANIFLYFRCSWGDNNAGSGDAAACQGNTSPNGTITIDYIKLGDQTGLTVTGNEENIVSASLNVYPNPASTSVNVSFEASADATVSLSDLTGSSVASAAASKGLNDISLDVSSLASGLYILSITTADGVVTRKVTVD